MNAFRVLLALFASTPSLVLAAGESGLPLHYSFDQSSTGPVVDDSGNGRTAMVHGAAWSPDGAMGGCYRFGGNDTIAADDRGLPAGDAPRTLSWWFSLDRLRPDPVTSEMISYGTHEVNQLFAVGMDWRIGRDCPVFSPWGWVALSNVRIERAGEWHHAAISYSGSGRLAYYADGVLCRTLDESGGAPMKTVLGGSFLIGRHAGHGVDGRIDEVRLYGRALEAADVLALYRARPAAPSATAAVAAPVPVPTVTGMKPSPRVGALDRANEVGGSVAQIDTGFAVTRIGFSNHPRGDRDVTVFQQNETLHVWVQDVDLVASDTNLQVRASVYQRSDREGQSDVTRLLQPQPDDSFYASLPLAGLRPGRAQVDIAGYDLGGRVMRLFRTSQIQIVPQRAGRNGIL